MAVAVAVVGPVGAEAIGIPAHALLVVQDMAVVMAVVVVRIAN